MNTTLVLADDHPLLLAGIAHILKQKNFTICEVASDGNQAYNAIVKHQPDLAILDFDMPKLNGLEVAKACQAKALPAKIIILTLHKQEAILKEIGHTIQGYILKDDALNELERCITEVLQNNTYVSQKISENIHIQTATRLPKSLTTTEIKILKHLASDKSSAEISNLLFVSKRTVEKHRSNIIKKLGIKSTQNALLLWVKDHPELFNT
ncbi:MAG: DNA-binding response regulator [Flavobacteriales bacterium CG_4_9_14_3_um_filter_40_17]|nr:MAG: DNA-binding response regulator [Flavobacteriales bacterium CG_4_9_14_3_um_filter_40_17]